MDTQVSVSVKWSDDQLMSLVADYDCTVHVRNGEAPSLTWLEKTNWSQKARSFLCAGVDSSISKGRGRQGIYAT